MNIPLALLLIFLGLLGSAYYSGLETGTFAINRLRLRHLVRTKVKGAAILDDFLKKPDHLLGTTLVGNNISNQLASVTALSLGAYLADNAGYLAAYIIITTLMLIVGEYLPKAWFQGKPSIRTLPFMRSLQINGILFYPIAVVLTRVAKFLVPVRQKKAGKTKPFITVEEIRHLTQVGEKSGSLSSDEREMIEKVLSLAHAPCARIMIPREEMILIHADTLAEEILEIARSKKHSRFPVFDEDHERFVGIVHIFDLLTNGKIEGKTAQDVLRAPQFVSEDTPCDEVLTRMRMTRQPMALVTDDRSEVVGLVTSEQVLEEIVGEM